MGLGGYFREIRSGNYESEEGARRFLLEALDGHGFLPIYGIHRDYGDEELEVLQESPWLRRLIATKKPQELLEVLVFMTAADS